MKKRAAMLLAGMMVLSLAVPCAAGAEETNDSEYYYVNGKAPEEVTGNILFWSWDPNFFDMVQKMLGSLPTSANHERIASMRDGRLGIISGFPASFSSDIESPSSAASGFERDIIATHGPLPTAKPSRCSVS